MKSNHRARRSMVTGLGAVAAAFALRPASAGAQATAPQTPFQPARHPQDEWMDALPGKHRTVIDCAAAGAAGTGVFYANNIFTANRNGYQLADSDVAVIVVLRHEATTFAYNDAMWAKYGAVLGNLGKIADPRTNQPPSVNPLNSREFGTAMGNLGVTAAALASRGAHFAICDMATNRIAGVIAAAVTSTAPVIYEELVANLLPNGHMVAAGVVAINRAQERGYAMLTPTRRCAAPGSGWHARRAIWAAAPSPARSRCCSQQPCIRASPAATAASAISWIASTAA